MAYKVILEDGSVSIAKQVGVRASDGLAVEEFQIWESGALVPDSEVAPRIVDLYDAGDLYTRSLIARIPSADDDVDEEAEKSVVPDPSKPVDEGGNEPVGTGQDPADAVPANAAVPSDVTEPGPSTDTVSDSAEDYEQYTIPVLKEKIGGRGLTVPSDANKPDLIKILQDDDKGGASNPFTSAS